MYVIMYCYFLFVILFINTKRKINNFIISIILLKQQLEKCNNSELQTFANIFDTFPIYDSTFKKSIPLISNTLDINQLQSQLKPIYNTLFFTNPSHTLHQSQTDQNEQENVSQPSQQSISQDVSNPTTDLDDTFIVRTTSFTLRSLCTPV